MVQHFWQRWSREYPAQLQTRSKWHGEKSEVISPGALVIIEEDNMPPLMWPLGRILKVHPGADNVVRVVTVQTRNGVYKRPITKICILPMDIN